MAVSHSAHDPWQWNERPREIPPILGQASRRLISVPEVRKLPMETSGDKESRAH